MYKCDVETWMGAEIVLWVPSLTLGCTLYACLHPLNDKECQIPAPTWPSQRATPREPGCRLTGTLREGALGFGVCEHLDELVP